MLKGLCVVDFSRYLPGPFASLRLADLGAEVIKVEPPLSGDPARQMGGELGGTGLLFLANNRDKKSVTINLKEKPGQELAFMLASKADVVIESFRPGVADALGIGYQALKKVRPDLIYCSLTGFGQSGLLSDLGSHDLNYMALSGVLVQMKDKQGRPVQPCLQFADMIGGIGASEAILAALVKRSLTHEGSYLDYAITDTLIGMTTLHSLIQKVTGTGYGISDITGGIIAYNIYETGDGRYLSLGALEKKFWVNFCRAVNQEDWIKDHFSPADMANATYIDLMKLFKSRTFAEWAEFGLKVDCCLMPILENDEMMSHDYVASKSLVWEQKTDSWGNLIQVATSVGGVGSNVTATEPPTLGQHTQEVLRNLLGATPSQIEDWTKQGII
ncbi:CaiB/BaiF CoA-transferase family protein [Desulfosporosinus sp. Sb-LF]|uniref:CaiB/BaiF CoA transferase family protein n=1 Tax=Desulfosporosinus sp. Sb-LF TaxID=2560027 RepID=UPI00107F5EA1|nr:CaiB/BaiF CoA-transferase family protein [Desulfosporosinus sp. Sb-LF]TGE33634.1 CoA transferase [Desulfosporosinus sp. Sb-LF]